MAIINSISVGSIFLLLSHISKIFKLIRVIALPCVRAHCRFGDAFHGTIGGPSRMFLELQVL